MNQGRHPAASTMHPGMSQSSEDIARSAFAAFTARDVEALVLLADPGIEFLPVTAMITSNGEPYRGHEGLRRYFEDIERVWDDIRATPREFQTIGDHVVAVGRVYAHGGGRVVDSPAAWVWRIEGGLIVWGKVFPDPVEAMAYVGVVA